MAKALKQRMKVCRRTGLEIRKPGRRTRKTGVVINCLGSKALVRWEESGQSYSYRWGETNVMMLKLRNVTPAVCKNNN